MNVCGHELYVSVFDCCQKLLKIDSLLEVGVLVVLGCNIRSGRTWQEKPFNRCVEDAFSGAVTLLCSGQGSSLLPRSTVATTPTSQKSNCSAAECHANACRSCPSC